MPPETPDEALPEAVAVPARRARFSTVWIVPIVAALVALGIAGERLLEQGPTVTIVFQKADGVEAGKTFVKYKDVNIGQVTAVRLTDDFGRVEVTAKMAKSAAGLMVDDAKLWVVRPRISLSGVSGLSTLLSGVYIGFEAGASKTPQRKYTGLEVPPIITDGMPGRQFVLKAADLGSLGVGSPVYFRRLPVGQVVAYDLAADGSSVELRLFVNAPYDKYVSDNTRFWNASGIDVSLSANGFDVRTQSLVALLEGGLAFDTPARPGGGPPAAANRTFTLFRDRAVAMAQDESIAAPYVMNFDESLRGLSVGAPVTFFGVPVGEVTGVGLGLDVKNLNAHPRVQVVLYPDRMIASLPTAQEKALASEVRTPAARQSIMRRMIEERGLRGQLATGSLLTGQLYVALSYFPKAPKAKLPAKGELVELPTVPSIVPQLETKLASIVDKLDRVQFDAIGNDLRKTLASLDQMLKDADRTVNRIDADVVPALKTALDDARTALASAERMITSTESTLVGPAAPGQQEFRNALSELARAARSLRVLADYLERHPESLLRGKPVEPEPR